MSRQVLKIRLKQKRKQRTRSRIYGTNERPRLSVFRSAVHLYAQVIDDDQGKTLVSVSSFSKNTKSKANVAGCVELGKKLAEECKSKDITKIVFDKNGNAYHGRVKAFADGAREGGLIF